MTQLSLGSHPVAEVFQRLVVDRPHVVHLHLLGVVLLLLDHDIVRLVLSRRAESGSGSFSLRSIALVPVRLELFLAIESILT